MNDRPPFERITSDRAHAPRWTEVFLAQVRKVGTNARAGQVQVSLHSYDGAANQSSEVWARVAVPVAGGRQGTFLVPTVGDEVLVTFVGGDSRMAVVIGSLWNGQHAAPETPDNDQKVETWSFTSPAGTRISVVETSAADSVVTVHIPGKASAVVSAEGSGRIELNAGGSSLVIDEHGVRIDTGGEFYVNASTSTQSAANMDFDTPSASFTGVVQAPTVQADSVMGTTYTPGAGNIW